MNKDLKDILWMGAAILFAYSLRSALEHNQTERREYNRRARKMRADKIIRRPTDDMPIYDEVSRAVIDTPNKDGGLGMAANEDLHQVWSTLIRDSIIHKFPTIAGNIAVTTKVDTQTHEKKYRIPDICIYRKGTSPKMGIDYYYGLLCVIEIVHSSRNAKYSQKSVEEVAADNKSLREGFTFNYSESGYKRWSRLDLSTSKWVEADANSSVLGVNLNNLIEEYEDFGVDDIEAELTRIANIQNAK